MIGAVFNHRIRGFRTINLIGMTVLIVMALTVNLAKTYAGRERSQIDRIDRHIQAEQARIRLLQAEVAHLEQPNRLEKLSREALGMAPTTAKQEVAVAALPLVSGQPTEPVRIATALVAPEPAAKAAEPTEKPETAASTQEAPAKDAGR